MELERLNIKATIRTDEAVDPRIADEVQAINAAFDNATEALDADRKSLPVKSTDPVKVETFEC